ncbi:hypothetical protein [Pseudonocardia sp. HH130629-09]|nr:hypothetical protein [Pseudonocardia sp. HH130629-09]
MTPRQGRPQGDPGVLLVLARAAYVNGVCLPVDGGLSARSR